MGALSAELEALGLSQKEKAELKACLKKEGISNPLIIREYRKRGPVYYSLIFDSAKHSTEVFGLPPLKMANFKGVYLADGQDYAEKVSQIAERLRHVSVMKKFREGKNRASAELKKLVSVLNETDFKKLSNEEIHGLIKKFYEIRYPYTQYSFLFSTVTKSTEKLLDQLFHTVGLLDKDKYLAYIPNCDTIEFTLSLIHI